MSTSKIVKYAQFSFDFSKCEVHIGSSITELEPKVMKVLSVLYECQGEVISQKEIFEKVWQGRVYSQSLIQRAITLIRKALNEDASSAKFLITYPKQGYCLTPQNVSSRISPPTASNIFKVLLVLVVATAFMLFYQFVSYESSFQTYTSLSSITKQHSNDYSISQNSSSGELLFIRKEAENYELWKKSPDKEQKIYTSKHKILHTFWIGNSPAFTQYNEQNSISFMQLIGQDKGQIIFEKNTELTSAPIANESTIYFASKNTIYEFNTKTNTKRILHIFTDIKTIKDISFSKVVNKIAILLDKGQLNHQVVTLHLDNLSLKKLYNNYGEYNSIEWHPQDPSLLLTKSNKLILLNFDGSTSDINYATDRKLSSAIFALDGRTIYLEHNYLNVSLVKSEDIEGDVFLSDISYSGANLFPKNNFKNSKLLFQSDHNGLQTLYLKEDKNDVVISQARKGENINGYAWSHDGQKIAFAINNEITIKDEKGESKKITLENSLYIRGWFRNEPKLLVNQLIGGKPYPAVLNIKDHTIENLSDSTASCAVLESNNNLYFVQNDQVLIKQTPDGKRKVIHNLINDEYDDLFVSKKFLYASVKSKNTHYVQKFDLRNFVLSQHELPNKAILAGVNKDDNLWSYRNIQYESSLYKLF
ncbi:winged helix-turn-helix domain-containing protein [Litorilituus lipolyticus]|uniref:OmpR/PhoB-type domain-containing protein n=1 Tax=Litorilituus lipolyticus TaxID=2491017 RepID=A0A502KYT6_9GAMM|nr:winged helix-turn-helix domain-containing protein [Litorilituus lipolyticus]TPH13407.1 hypothetical protein EPA86_14560 [Litorilituus lipolyticus]